MRKPVTAETRAKIAERQRLYREAHVRYVIRYQWRRPGGCRPDAAPYQWRSWRSFGSVPILFKTHEEARTYLDKTAFKNMRHLRKVSASITRQIIK